MYVCMYVGGRQPGEPSMSELKLDWLYNEFSRDIFPVDIVSMAMLFEFMECAVKTTGSRDRNVYFSRVEESPLPVLSSFMLRFIKCLKCVCIAYVCIP